MESTTQVQILDKVVCISLYTNTLGKDINPSVHLILLWINIGGGWVI